MSQRNKSAKVAQEGACNPRPLSNALMNAISDCFGEGVMPENDPAVFMILHQLAYILGRGDFALTEQGHERYSKAYDAVFPAEVAS